MKKNWILSFFLLLVILINTSKVEAAVEGDKTLPVTPTVNNLTNKSFTISGKAEPNTIVYVKRDSNYYLKTTVDSNGNYTIPMPQQKYATIMEIYSVDRAENKSLSRKVVVKSQPRLKRKILNVSVIRQLPELPRGCEVTSLAMLLNYSGTKANKMTLAKQVKKDPAKLTRKNGKIYFGHPNYGFVGNMYTFNKPGWGVFNKPIEALAEKYKPNRIKNLTGKPFETILSYVSAGHPVWIINTSWFSRVPNEYWQTWYTSHGTIRITYKEHSVVITGYDSNYVYFNDPLDGTKNKKRPIKSFVAGWKQFGSQAISYY
ncbi:C39 family peptidase [Neobacillus sp. OS1-33]|uniref:C39 family peptidase n=1 Tax=Neobacillus sp. OS1-33 TaxID=3070683 RepID=UPI0027E04340|nr:C39 family peptidase [Neobacillus sp. OS1-33]WML28517.1 C39 family peptidase [Neobacillus sp. OS1-33]